MCLRTTLWMGHLQSMDQTQPRPVTKSVGLSVDWSQTVNDQLEEEAILCRFHWFLEGWIGDHSVDFLVDSGSAVTAVSCSFYKAMARVGAPVGALRPTRGSCEAPTAPILIFWKCSSCVV